MVVGDSVGCRGLYGVLWGCVGCITLTTVWDSRGIVGGCRGSVGCSGLYGTVWAVGDYMGLWEAVGG